MGGPISCRRCLTWNHCLLPVPITSVHGKGDGETGFYSGLPASNGLTRCCFFDQVSKPLLQNEEHLKVSTIFRRVWRCLFRAGVTVFLSLKPCDVALHLLRCEKHTGRASRSLTSASFTDILPKITSSPCICSTARALATCVQLLGDC
ncbi:hypothetical protein KC19_2G056200 [Ceratodon purpureus]|uniref:Uncharacterized protein n=1 Tax=Ceratodon purpureus TaxID=3225 RepID=A0A8T0ISL9_CERPU|nr:hypothetical protein KC19_2G056200 [Ceratodon purpureus]